MTITIIASDIFTKEQCESIISLHSNGWDGMVGTYGYGKTDPSFRQCMVYTPPSIEFIPKWMQETIANTTNFVNEENYNFDLGQEIEIKLLRYDSGGHYKTHIDIGQKGMESRRKLSFTILLNDSYEGGKLNFIGMKDRLESNPKIGDMIAFPSYLLHEVEPVTSGIRWVLVGWCIGDKHFV